MAQCLGWNQPQTAAPPSSPQGLTSSRTWGESNKAAHHMLSISAGSCSHSCKTVFLFLLQGRVLTLSASQWQLWICHPMSDLSWILTTDVYFLFFPDSHHALNKHSQAFISAFIISLVYHGPEDQLFKLWVHRLMSISTNTTDSWDRIYSSLFNRSMAQPGWRTMYLSGAL